MVSYEILDEISQSSKPNSRSIKKLPPTSLLNRRKQMALSKERLQTLNKKLLFILLDKNLEEIFLTLLKTTYKQIILKLKSPIDDKPCKLIFSIKK